ncbi:RDD family protein [uncultured Microbacterium sp.]|uniref:RDD family protein n=1 Tax=uncultured Microbacterium sp. TaxID=191216 RepID=UPI0028D67B59|nr:RDD family protein [uncultured Microbacterium sp.]
MIWEVDEQKPTIEGLDAQGRPDPAYAAALGLLRAPFGRRALAVGIDVAIWLVLMLPLLVGAAPLLLKLAGGTISAYGFLNHPDFLLAAVTASASTLLGLVYLLVQLILHGRRGMTIGKAASGIRSVNVRTLERPRVGAALLRFLIVVAAGVVPLLGPVFILVSPTFDPERRGRGLHDKATGIWLVDVRKGLNPYDEKRMRVARKMVKAEPILARTALPSLATPVDPAAQPEYLPGRRVSAGVLGMARPREATPRAVPAETPVRWSLRFDSGESIPIASPVLLGRNPDAKDHPGASAVALPDESMSLSKTHLLARPVEGGLEILDCRSTNGSGLIRGGAEHAIVAGTPTTAREGDVIRLGDRVATVVRA